MGSITREQFQAKVELIPFSDCHYWLGQLNDQGYGLVGRVRAHRIAYELAKGPIPAGLVIRHRCDNPMCVNPAHLELGTQGDNVRDASLRARNMHGERHVFAKLTDAQTLEIVAACERGEQTGALAARYGVGRSRISMIRHGNVGRNHPARHLRKPTGRCDRRVSDETALAIYRAAHGGGRNCDIANSYGVQPSFVADIKRGTTYARVTGHGGENRPL